ncbi:MAG: polysaccharide deacetylase family protein [Chloroflexi bacterium]|nr:polysaccharide deacetylase family protein [Chloroflexota bacterium]
MLSHLIRSKGPLDLFRRLRAIADRVGLTPGPMRRALNGYVRLARRYAVRVTLPVPAVILKRYPAILRELLGDGEIVELALHGQRHVDHSLLPTAQLSAEIAQATHTFAALGIPFVGFRAPYLRWSADLLTALDAAGLAYDSSQSVLWPVVDAAALDPAQRAALNTLLAFDRPRPAEVAPALPFWVDGLLEIPVSFPDDEMLVERLRLRSPEQLAAYWIAAFDACHARGELFVLQLHPERFELCADAVETLLRHVQALGSAVWRPSLRDVSDWWREKRALTVRLTPLSDGRWAAVAQGPARGVLLARSAGLETPGIPHQGRAYQRMPERRCVLRSDRRPCVGVSARSARELAPFLSDLGYVVEVGDAAESCTVYLDRPTFAAEASAPLLAEIEAAAGPLVRLNPWPDAAVSALALSGDIDAITLWDYGWRLFGA